MDMQELALEYLQILCSRPEKPRKEMNKGLIGEMAVLRYLYETKDGAMPSEISEHLRLTAARIANILASLEKKELIERKQDAKDRRKVQVYLTEAGKHSADEGRQNALRHFTELLNRLGEEDARELVRLERRKSEILYEIDAEYNK